MFQLVSERIVRDWPIQISVAKDGGKVETYDVSLDFKLLDAPDFRTFSAQGDDKLFAEVVRGWSGIFDAEGQPLPFNPQNLAAVCRNQSFTAGALQGYMKAMSGVASTKNS
ncbi:hypothetical protein [Photobacterium atrarenae]|uniref:Uncharacterized protein n=1 Tax=Photobacterium atrarenae TaxID=865757 RepID=A0ABY5GN11_9GAMM|nr:hypothetical protein [Photobacterium atrarenae]UTV30161.1 hypothetical protein NNL38_16375 [Photobacterium atrarenae]